MRKTLTSLLLALCFVYTYAQKPVLTPGSPEASGMSSDRLQRIDRVVQDYISKGWLTGASAFIARNGKIVYHKTYGQNDVDTKSPVSRDAIYRIASQTKAITSVAVMMLFEEGRFMLDEPISNYIPEFKNPQVLDKFNEKDTTFTTVPAKREVTIRHLLTHTSGISYAGIGTKEANAIYAKYKIPSGIGTPNDRLSDKIPGLGKLPLIHQPGERFTYGLNTDVLGYLVEVVSGQSLDQFFRTRIFEPLGMKDTYFYLPTDKQNRLAVLYTEKDGKVIKSQPQGGNTPDYPKLKGTYYSGGAGLSSTAYDYAIFLQMLLNGGEYNGRRLLSPATVRMMTTNQIGELYTGTKKFGLGFGLTGEREAARVPVPEGTFDWGGIFGTTYWADPKEGIVALFMTQQYPNSHGLGDKFRVLVYQAITNSQEPMLSGK
ncbi:serine hydrolase domain-containing protein [Nibrella saemangeumensis]|uniref:Serine hydrolase domain-containing protein n=1 Tax=Nibrella saemangeumensis TaxID=1084526 RepID=A0ABP8NLX4_9BACT